MKKRLLIIIISSVIVLLVLFAIYSYKLRTRNAIEKFAANNRMINILIAGSNIYNENRHSFYSIISLNPENGRIGLTFIPPAFKVDLDGSGRYFYRIDEIDINDFKKLSDSLYSSLKLKIPFYVVLYSPDVERVVDLIGGIDLYVLDQVKGIHGIKFGLNYFDGEKIVQYINSTEEASIFTKYDRIQDILLTLYSSRDRYNKYINLELISEVIKSIKTNLMPQEVMTFAEILYKKKSNIISTILPGYFDDTGFYNTNERSYKIYEKDFLKKIVIDTDFHETIKIKILNGTSISGLAKKMRRFFIRKGLKVVEFGTSPYPQQDNTVIINQKGNTEFAEKVSGMIGVGIIHHIIDTTQLNNVLLIIGKDMPSNMDSIKISELTYSN